MLSRINSFLGFSALLQLEFFLSPVRACEPGWFGEGCVLKCRCVECNYFGECVGPDKRCMTNWFGPNCQYNDLTHFSDPRYTEPWLIDQRDDTCNENEHLLTASILLGISSPFTWLRLVLNSPVNMNDNGTDVTFNGGEVPCAGMVSVPVNERTLDIHCNLQQKITAIEVSGDIVKDLCSVYISMGRNIALKQYARVAHFPGGPGNLVAEAADGDTAFSLMAHYVFLQPTSDPSYTVFLTRPYKISHVMLHHIRGNPLKNITFQAFKGDWNLTWEFNEPNEYNPQIYHLLYTNPEPIVFFSLNIEPSGNRIYLTELEIYGEALCPEGTFGLTCDRTCSCSGAFAYCMVTTGHCTQPCPPQLYGENCDLECTENCSYCHRETGECIYCRSGFSGPSCDTECKSGYFGYNCGQRCPKQCRDGKCDSKTGGCYACSGGFYMTPCDSGTGAGCGQYLNCTQRCSKRCYQRSCDGLTGNCLKCHTGHSGPRCDMACPCCYYENGSHDGSQSHEDLTDKDIASVWGVMTTFIFASLLLASILGYCVWMLSRLKGGIADTADAAATDAATAAATASSADEQQPSKMGSTDSSDHAETEISETVRPPGSSSIH